MDFVFARQNMQSESHKNNLGNFRRTEKIKKWSGKVMCRNGQEQKLNVALVPRKGRSGQNGIYEKIGSDSDGDGSSGFAVHREQSS